MSFPLTEMTDYGNSSSTHDRFRLIFSIAYERPGHEGFVGFVGFVFRFSFEPLRVVLNDQITSRDPHFFTNSTTGDSKIIKVHGLSVIRGP
jgi:hypothetical protein